MLSDLVSYLCIFSKISFVREAGIDGGRSEGPHSAHMPYIFSTLTETGNAPLP